MKATALSDACVELIEQQAELITKMTAHESVLQEAIAQRDWVHLETTMRAMTALGEAIVAVEARRSVALDALAQGLEGEAVLSKVLASLPADHRERLSSAYRSLKVAVLGLQSRTAGMDAYIRSSMSTTRGVLKELYPEHTSAGYSRSGHGHFSTSAAVMVDREL